jgi:hypothetical protein
MKPDEKAENLIRESGMEARQEWLEQTKADTLNAFEQAQDSRAPAEGIWRTIMKNRMTQIAAAAVLIAAVWIGIYFSNIGGVVWAEVIRPVLEAVPVEYDAVVDEGSENPQRLHDVVFGPRIRRTYAEGPVKEAIIDTDSRTLFVVVPSEKTAVTIRLENLPETLNPMSRVRDILLELQNDPDFEVEKAGTDRIDGRPAVGFLARHPRKELVVWADPETSLPIRIDVQEERVADVVCRNFRFDGEVVPSRMEMEVPPGYVHEEHVLDLAGLPEKDLVEGLRFYAELNGGVFPEDISVLHCMQPGENVRRRIETLSRQDQEALQILMQMIRQFLLLQYYRGPGQWRWVGAGVELGDANTPIYWYQPMHSSACRVIFGDLHVEDVAEGELPGAAD